MLNRFCLGDNDVSSLTLLAALLDCLTHGKLRLDSQVAVTVEDMEEVTMEATAAEEAVVVVAAAAVTVEDTMTVSILLGGKCWCPPTKCLSHTQANHTRSRWRVQPRRWWWRLRRWL